MRSTTTLAIDTFVHPRSPVAAAAACALTLGITGAVRLHRINDELARFGRARGRMPFPFVRVNAGAATCAWLVGVLCWIVVAASAIAFAIALAGGSHDPSSSDVTTIASFALLLAPLLLVTAGTARRIRTAQHLAGVDGSRTSPLRIALLCAAFPPLGSWALQREVNRAWEQYAP